MSKYHYVDDAILLVLLQKEEEDSIWQTAYEGYREPFVHFFRQHFDKKIELTECLNLYTQTFDIVIRDARNGAIRSPLGTHLFHYLLIAGSKLLIKKGISVPSDFQKQVTPVGKFLAGDVLLLLAVRLPDDKVLFDVILEKYQAPALELIKTKSNYTDIEISEGYYESVSKLKGKVNTQAVKPPLTGKLFNYFYTIFWRETRDRRRKNGGENAFVISSDPTTLNDQLPDEPEEKSDQEIERLERWAKGMLKRTDYEEDKGLLEKIIDWAKEPLRTILKLHYLEGLSFKQIGEIIGKTEGATRKAHHVGIEKLRDFFDIDATEM